MGCPAGSKRLYLEVQAELWALHGHWRPIDRLSWGQVSLVWRGGGGARKGKATGWTEKEQQDREEERQGWAETPKPECLHEASDEVYTVLSAISKKQVVRTLEKQG
jgi:hypothetical protein